MQSKNILVINQYFSPDLASTGQYAAEICHGLARNGKKVRVITAQPCYSRESPEAPLQEEDDGLSITRIPMGRLRGRENLITRIAGYLYFLIKARREASRLSKKHRIDLVITFHNPPFVGLLGAFLKRKKQIPFVYILYDINPDALLSSGWKIPSVLVWFWERLNKKMLTQASKVVVLSERMKESLKQKKGVEKDKIEIIPPWGRPELVEIKGNVSVRQELGLGEDELLLLYAGNMGVIHPLEVIIEAARELIDLPLKILFVGDGTQRQSLEEQVTREKIKNVLFLPYQPEDRFVELLGAADCCFVTLRKSLDNLSLPSRAFTFLSAGKPIIALMEKETDLSQLITDNQCGWVVEGKEQLTALIKRLFQEREEILNFGLNARQVYMKHYRKEKIIKKYIEVVDNCLNSEKAIFGEKSSA